MQIKNLKSNLEMFSRNTKYKICAGIVALGVIAAGIYGITAQEKAENEAPKKSITEMSYEEQDEKYAMLKTNFKNIEYLNDGEDTIGFLQDHESLRGGVFIEPGREMNTIPLVPGEYNATSETGATTSFTVEDIDQNFILDMDYATGQMQVHEVEEISHTK